MSELIRILHVDDDPDFTDLTATFLEREDDRFAVETATDADDGLDRLADAAFDCIVSDYEMPDRNGIDFLETVRREHPELPFILFTGKGSEEVASDAISSGATDYLQKGGGSDQYTVLANRIGNAVERMHAQCDRQRQLNAVESAREGIAIVDPDGRFVFVNDAYAEMYGFDAGTLRGDHWERVYPDEVVSAMRERVLPTVEREGTWHGDLRGRRANGETFLQDQAVSTNDHDELVFTVRDVTDRRQRERRLEEQNAKIEALHAVATYIEACDTDSEVYETVVEAAESILEFDIAITDAAEGDMLVPQAVSSHLSAEQYYETTPIDDENNLAAEAYRTGEPSRIDDVRAHDAAPADTAFRSVLSVPIGEYGVFQSVSKSPSAFDETDLELLELLIAHATEQLARLETERELRERTAELERQNDRLNEFATVVSHDLRNPLNVAEGRLELVREDCESEHFDDIAAALDRMNALMDNLLDLAREGEDVDDVAPVELAPCCQACWGSVETDDATLVIDTDRTVLADEVRLQQLFENLVRNAVEHGGSDVTITVGELEGGFYVADDGPGIDPEERERVFESGYSTSDDGTGFGLSIVHEIATAHGWHLDVTDGADGGTRFEITGVEPADRARRKP